MISQRVTIQCKVCFANYTHELLEEAMIIAPSLLAADFLHLHDEVKAIETAGADYIHCDIMDGNFVPNISFGTELVGQVRNITDLPLDVHLMVNNPEIWISPFAKAGADHLYVHGENNHHLHRTLELIHKSKCKAGVVLNPATPVLAITEVLPMVDFVLVMTVNPGYGGQQFISSCAKKIIQLNELRNQQQYNFKISVDGGINIETAKRCREKGADILVAGSSIFNAKDYSVAISKLRGNDNEI